MELDTDSTKLCLAGNSCAVTCDVGTTRDGSNHYRETSNNTLTIIVLLMLINYCCFSYNSINCLVNETHSDVKTAAEKRLAFLRARNLIESFSSERKDNASANLAAYSLASEA